MHVYVLIAACASWSYRDQRIKTSLLDAHVSTSYIGVMRTTLTLDDDVAMLLKRRVHESGQSFKEVVNRVLRAGLLSPSEVPGSSSIPQPRSLGGARVDLDQALSLAEGLGDDEVTRQLRA